MKRKIGERGLKPLREVYEGKKVTCGVLYDCVKEDWKQETKKVSNSDKKEIIFTMQKKKVKTVLFEGEYMNLKGEEFKLEK